VAHRVRAGVRLFEELTFKEADGRQRRRIAGIPQADSDI
jgi:hypothetical protein